MYYVIWKSGGGLDNQNWNRVLAEFREWRHADDVRQEIRRMGYETRIVGHDLPTQMGLGA